MSCLPAGVASLTMSPESEDDESIANEVSNTSWTLGLQYSDDDQSLRIVQWNLGFVRQPVDACSLLRHQFPSKVGGRPVRPRKIAVLSRRSSSYRCSFAFAGMAGSVAPANSSPVDLWPNWQARQLPLAGKDFESDAVLRHSRLLASNIGCIIPSMS